MNNKRFVWIVMATCVVFSVACKSKKMVQTTPQAPPIEVAAKPNETEVLIDKVNANGNAFNYYQAKAVANYKDDKQNMGLDVSIIMEKDRYIWMSVTAVLGIEVARIYITQDSVKILDRLHRKYIATDFGFIQQFANAPLQLANLQNLFVGNTLFSNSVQKSVVDTVLGNLAITTLLQAQKLYTVYGNNFKVLKGNITQTDQAREMKYSYESFANFGQNSFPNHININIRAEKNVECKLELNNFVFDKKREIQFTVPSNYEVVKP